MIKNFKIVLRQGYILRSLRKTDKAITEQELSDRISEIQKHLKPATIYDTLAPALFKKSEEFGKAVAISLFAVTLGEEVESLEKTEILSVSLKDGLEAAKTFVLKLIQLEAEEEHCEILEPVEVGPEVIFENKKILSKIDFAKIGIKFESGILKPENTKFMLAGWLVKKRK